VTSWMVDWLGFLKLFAKHFGLRWSCLDFGQTCIKKPFWCCVALYGNKIRYNWYVDLVTIVQTRVRFPHARIGMIQPMYSNTATSDEGELSIKFTQGCHSTQDINKRKSQTRIRLHFPIVIRSLLSRKKLRKLLINSNPVCIFQSSK
jgi:hypothetical protein